MSVFFSFSEPLGQCRIYRICPPTQNEHPQAFPAQAASFPDAPPPARALGPAREQMSGLEDGALGLIFQFALLQENAFSLSLVCRQWRDVVREPFCWAGKVIKITVAALAREDLEAWLPRWRFAKLICMSCSQMDLLAAPPAAPHAIVHQWKTEFLRDGGPLGVWRETVIDAEPWLVCLTDDRVPDHMVVLQHRNPRGDADFREAVWLGWTSAAYVDELAAMSTRIESGRARQSDVVLGVTMLPLSQWERAVIVSMLRGRAPVGDPPTCFDDDATKMVDLRLDRACGALRLNTEFNGPHMVQMSGALRRSRGVPLRFFFAVPDRGRRRRRGVPMVPCPVLEPSLWA